MNYSNPVRRGFYPDPSVIRVGEDFYMVNSSFQYFPCIPISHSKDMVHWETIGHAITDPSYLDLSGIKDSHGIWAPDIFYDNGTFYIIATMRLNDSGEEKKRPSRQQLIMRSNAPGGPYSKPVWLNANSIDPSLFFDGDGRKYMITAKAATAWELNDDCTEIIDGPKVVWNGTGERCSEGPHIMKHNGYYYAIAAEGGTGYGHGINVARSTELFGEYENCPYNPVMRQKDPDKLIQRAGHGKLVEDQNGDWWAYYLCGRRNGGNYTTLGRETALDPVRWTDDGWFLINEGNGPSEIQKGPDLPDFKGEPKNFFDDFDSDDLNLEWEFVRNPDYNYISLNEEKKCCLRLYTTDGNLSELKAKNTLVHREAEFKYRAETKMNFEPEEGAWAGLTCYYSTATYIRFNITLSEGKRMLELVINRNQGEESVSKTEIPDGWINLRVDVDGQKRTFSYSMDGENYIEAGTVNPCIFLCDEGVPTDRKRHTGTMVGLFAGTDSGKRIPADFDWFKIDVE